MIAEKSASPAYDHPNQPAPPAYEQKAAAPAVPEGDVVWKSCCGQEVTKKLVAYLGSFIISLITLIFCGVQIAISDQDTTVYWATATGILGVFLPQPAPR